LEGWRAVLLPLEQHSDACRYLLIPELLRFASAADLLAKLNGMEGHKVSQRMRAAYANDMKERGSHSRSSQDHWPCPLFIYLLYIYIHFIFNGQSGENVLNDMGYMS